MLNRVGNDNVDSDNNDSKDGSKDGNKHRANPGNTIAEQPSHVHNAHEGKILNVGSLQLTIKATGVETGGRFTLVEITVPPYFSDGWPHFHQQTTESIYLLQGMLAVTLGEETMVVRQGAVIVVSPQQVHRFWNPTAIPATYLAFFTPAGIEEYFEALSEVGQTEATWPPSDLARLLNLGMTYDHFPAASTISSEQA
jgi:quercetin dioxygenase-like cupin family protein